ncbi:unnamed protein product [Discula destructiva]
MEQLTVRYQAEATTLTVAPFEKELIRLRVTAIEDDADDPQEQVSKEDDCGNRIIRIQVFDPQTEPAEKLFAVSILDCIMPRMLVPVTCTYQLEDGANQEAVLSNMCEGLRRLLGEYKHLAGALHEPENGARAVVKRTASHATFDVHVRDVTVSDPDFPSFNSLKEQHFPPSQLDCMMPRLPAPSPATPVAEGIPAMVVQLNLIRGGLVMGIAIHHMLIDARGLDKLLARWAAHTRSVLDPVRYPLPSPLRPCDLDPSVLVSAISHTGTTQAIDYRKKAVPSLKYAPSGPAAAPSISLSAMDRHIWHIPASKLAALKASASVALGKDTQRWVSTNDCITALMWRAVTRARLAAHGIASPQDDARLVALENSLDVRGAFNGSGGGISEAYVGNVVMFSRAEMPLCQLVAPGTFRATALKVREAVEEYRAWSTVHRAIDWIAACPRGADVEMDVDVIGGLDVLATSWRVLKAYERADFGFGPLMALRWTAGMVDGYCFLYPTRPNGGEDEGVEIYLGLEKACMERLLLDEELALWADVRN